jgi:hypothetical protein
MNMTTVPFSPLQSAKVLKSVALVSFKLKSGAMVPNGNMLEGV